MSGRRRHLLAFAVALACAAALFRPWSGVFYFRDLALYHAPLLHTLTSLWQNDWFPLWDPYHALGQPLQANPNFMALYPPTELLRFLDVSAYMNLFIFAHWALAVLGLYAFLWTLGLSSTEALAGSLLFGLAGPAVSATLEPLILLPLAYLPWAMFFSLRAARKRSAADEAASALCTALVFLSGELASIFSGIVFLLIAALWGVEGGTFSFKPLLRSLALAVLLAGPQLLPSLELAAESGRTHPLDYQRVTTHSLPPSRMTESLLPMYFGNPISSSPDVYRGYEVFKEAPYLPSIFVGGTGVLLLAAFGLIARRRMCLPLIVAAAGFTLLSFGRFSLFHGVVASTLPVLRAVRYPEKFFLFASLALSVLAALGFHRLRESGRRAWIAAGAFFAAGLVLCVLASGGGWRPGFVATIVPAGLYMCARALNRDWLMTAGTTWLLAVLFWASIGLSPKVHALPAGNPIARVTGPASIVRLDDPPGLRLAPPDDRPIWGVLWDRDTLNYTTAAELGISTPFEADIPALYTSRQHELCDLMRKLTFADMSRLARLFSCRWFVTPTPTRDDVDSAMPIVTRSGPYAPTLYLCRLRGPVQGGAAIRDGRAAPEGHQDQLRAIVSPSFDWSREVLVEGPALSVPGGASAPAGTIEQELGTADDRRFRVEMKRAAYLVVNQSYYPGWKATIDGDVGEIVRANVAVMAVAVPQGAHFVRLRFFPASLLLGLAMFGLGAIVTVWQLTRGGRPLVDSRSGPTDSDLQ